MDRRRGRDDLQLLTFRLPEIDAHRTGHRSKPQPGSTRGERRSGRGRGCRCSGATVAALRVRRRYRGTGSRCTGHVVPGRWPERAEVAPDQRCTGLSCPAVEGRSGRPLTAYRLPTSGPGRRVIGRARISRDPGRPGPGRRDQFVCLQMGEGARAADGEADRSGTCRVGDRRSAPRR